MNQPQSRLIEGTDTRAAALRAAAEVPDLSPAVQARLRRQLGARASHTAQPLRPASVLAFVAAMALGGVVTHVLVRPAAPRSPFTVSEGTRSTPLPGGGLDLEAGTVTVRTQTLVEVRTPELEVLVREGRVAVASTLGRSSVEVFEGSAVVRQANFTLTLTAGHQVASDDPRLSSARLEVDAPGVDASCDGPDALTCLQRAAEGDDVHAQTALLRLGIAALAEQGWTQAEKLARTSLSRFPEGVMAPEVHLVLLEAVRQQGRTEAARTEAQWYLAEQRSAPSAPVVALVLGDLELRANRWDAARAAYGLTLELSPTPTLAQEAYAGIGVAALRAGNAAEARTAFEHALAAAPAGPRAMELRRRLNGP